MMMQLICLDEGSGDNDRSREERNHSPRWLSKIASTAETLKEFKRCFTNLENVNIDLFVKLLHGSSQRLSVSQHLSILNDDLGALEKAIQPGSLRIRKTFVKMGSRLPRAQRRYKMVWVRCDKCRLQSREEVVVDHERVR